MSKRRFLPPLNALRTFEAVARTLSFTRAADQLHVTQSAVSRQVKHLEDILGVELLRRRGSLQLTDEGRFLLPVLTESFDRIAEAVGRIRNQTGATPLVISLPPTFARRIVLPRLHEFQAAHADVEIKIETPSTNVDLRTAPVDMAVFFGEDDVSNLVVDLLMCETLTPVCSPRLAAEASGKDFRSFIQSQRLLHVQQRNEPWQDWEIFLRAAGCQGVDYQRGMVLETADLAVESAASHCGVAVVDVRLFGAYIADGRLAVPFDLALPSGRNYYLVSRAEEIEIPRIYAFRAWIIGLFQSPQFLRTSPPLERPPA